MEILIAELAADVVKVLGAVFLGWYLANRSSREERTHAKDLVQVQIAAKEESESKRWMREDLLRRSEASAARKREVVTSVKALLMQFPSVQAAYLSQAREARRHMAVEGAEQLRMRDLQLQIITANNERISEFSDLLSVTIMELADIRYKPLQGAIGAVVEGRKPLLDSDQLDALPVYEPEKYELVEKNLSEAAPELYRALMEYMNAD